MTASFFHSHDYRMASYRYRGAIPARALGCAMNDESAAVWIIAKIDRQTPALIATGRQQGKAIIVDACDLYLQESWYRQSIERADAVTAPTTFAAELLAEEFGMPVTVIPDPYELPECPPHVSGSNLFWFGHAQNYYSVARWLPKLTGYPVRIMTNLDGMIPWSLERLQEELAWADVVLIPETAPHKSCNRTVEAMRQGCLVVAEPHPSLEGFPGVWTGNLLKGIQWAHQNPQEAHERVRTAQGYIRAHHSPAHVASAWKTVIQECVSNSGVATSPGPDGSMSMDHAEPSMPMSSAT